MSSKRETILDAIKDALVSVTNVPDASVFRSRVSALSRREFPAILIEPQSETCERGATNHLDWTLQVSIMIMVRGSTPDLVADPICISVHNKIMSNSTLDGLVVDIVPQTVDWQIDEADLDLGIVRTNYLVRYLTSQNDLTS
jgi:hypothetical protein